MLERLTEPELMDFLFLPGFSTAGKVTEISGRGVGLDVVQSMVQEVGGRLRATSEFGAGTTFHLQLPITLSVIRALLVEISGEPYAFPLARIDRILMLPRDDIESIEDHAYFTLDDRHIGLAPAHQVLELEGGEAASEALPVVVISDHLNRYGLLVDGFLGERDLVVRPLDARLGKIPDIGAAAFMEDGAPVLIADVEDMVRSIDGLLSGGRLRKVGKLLAGTDALAVDSVMARMMGVDPRLLPVQEQARLRGLGTLEETEIDLQGELVVIPNFRMPVTFQPPDREALAELKGLYPSKMMQTRVASRPEYQERNCIKCGDCVENCPTQALTLEPEFSVSDECIACFCCVELCTAGALEVPDIEAFRHY